MTGAQDHETHIARVAGEPGLRLRAIDQLVLELAPGALPIISYRMPAFRFEGAILIYFEAFKSHTGVYPPLRAKNVFAEIKPFMGPKGNFKFPHDAPLPIEVIKRLITVRIAENRARGDGKKAR
jgi:uncharacterized protein YdhG (YjbR/CyaY superfamily)